MYHNKQSQKWLCKKGKKLAYHNIFCQLLDLAIDLEIKYWNLQPRRDKTRSQT